MKKFNILILLIFLFSMNCRAQAVKKDFLTQFAEGNNTEKLRLASKLSPTDLANVYPRIKETVEKIKRLSENGHADKECAFLLDIIEANLEQSYNNHAKAVFIVENCLQNKARNIHDSLLCYYILKTSFVKIRNFFKAYEINNRMETLWPKKNDSIYVPFGAEKSSLYASLGFIKEAISERRKEFAVLRQSNDTNVLYSFNSDLGIYFNRLKMSDSAAIFFNKALELVMNKKFTPDQKEQYEFLRAVTKGNLGLSYYNSGQPEKAIPLIKEDIYYSTRGNHFESLFLSHEVIAECYILTGNFKDAEAHIDTAELVFRTHFPNGIQKKYIYFVKSKYFSATGDFKQANVFLRKYYAYLDSINLIEKEQNLKNMQIAFKIQQKEQELSEKNNILEQKELSEAREKTFRAYSIIGILILAGLVVLLIVINFLSKKRERELYAKNEQIGKQNTLIEQSLKEKEVLIREIHHRVKNNLQIITSMLSLQMSKEEGKESEAILREAKQRISSIALTHQMLYQNPNLSDIPINEYIESLVRQIEYSIPPSDIELITELQENKKKVNIDYAVPLGLLINELLTNSFKHAFPNNEKGIISVKLQEDENNCIIRVSDNGVGLPEDFNFTANKSMGMDLIHILAEQLEARLTIKSGQGSSFTLAIPKNKLFV